MTMNDFPHLRPISAGILTDRMLYADGGNGSSGGAVLAFEALTYDPDTYEMLGVKTGTGDLSVAAGGGSKYAADHEGIYREYAEATPVWSGGRVVTNYARSTDDITTSSWTKTDVTVQTGIDDPDGGNTAFRVTSGTNTGATVAQAFNTGIDLLPVNTSIWVRYVSGDTTVEMYRGNATNWNDISSFVTSEWQRIYLDVGVTFFNNYIGLRFTAAAGAVFDMWHPQTEIVDTNPSIPSEYVENTNLGVPIGPNLPVSATYANENGNTVLNNVVTEAVGTPLADPVFLQYYPAATQDQIQSNDLANVEWTATTMTVAQDETGIDGAANTACTLTATGANSTVIANAITDAADDQATCWYLKRKTGTGNIDLTLDNGSTWTTVTLTSSFQKFTVDQAALANPQIGIRIVTSADAVIVGNAECYLGKNEVETQGLGPIFCTTAAVSTAAIDPISVPVANHADTDGLYYFEWEPSIATADATGDQIILSLNGAAGLLYYDATAGAFKATDGTNTVTVTKTIVAGTAYKLFLLYHATEAKMQISVDSTDGTEGTYDGGFTTTGDLEFAGGGDYSSKMRDWRKYSITSMAEGATQRDSLK